MPLDAVVLSALRSELETRVVGARIDKIFQPEKDELILQLRGMGENLRLFFSANQNSARVHVSTIPKENPQTPPMFCMLLRKILTGGIIRQIRQPPLERLLEFEIEAMDEMGMVVVRKLVLELIGRQSNLILLDEESRITDSLRRVDADISSKRQILPGMFYRLPPAQEKRNPLEIAISDLPGIIEAAPLSLRADKWLLDTFFGISPLIAREMAYRAAGEVSIGFFEMNRTQKTRFSEEVTQLFQIIQSGGAKPYLLTDQENPHDMSYLPITQYGGKYECTGKESFSELVETFYADRDKSFRIRQRSHELNKTASGAYERVKRKVEQQKAEYEAAKNRERLRESGDLLMANLHAISRGQRVAEVADFYDPEGRMAEIPLDPRLSAQQNAAKYYKDYNRMKNAERILAEQIAAGEQEILYLESVLDELARAESDHDIQEIREELQHTGYLRNEYSKKKKKQAVRHPMEFRSTNGFTILAGRGNLQNDQLTLRDAHKNDIWFHTQKYPGSHVIIRCEGQEPDDLTYTEAAMIAAYYSQAKDSYNVPVDYTRVRYVKKPAGSRPGMVIYDPYFTAYATPDKSLIEKLRIK